MFHYPAKYVLDVMFLAIVLIVPFWAIWESIQKQPEEFQPPVVDMSEAVEVYHGFTPDITPDGRSVSDQPALPDHK